MKERAKCLQDMVQGLSQCSTEYGCKLLMLCVSLRQQIYECKDIYLAVTALTTLEITPRDPSISVPTAPRHIPPMIEISPLEQPQPLES